MTPPEPLGGEVSPGASQFGPRRSAIWRFTDNVSAGCLSVRVSAGVPATVLPPSLLFIVKGNLEGFYPKRR